MSPIKLQRLPDRTPMKVTIALSPELGLALSAYAEAYEAAYNQAEPVTELIPAMLWSFLQSDRAFAKGRNSRRDQG